MIFILIEISIPDRLYDLLHVEDKGINVARGIGLGIAQNIFSQSSVPLVMWKPTDGTTIKAIARLACPPRRNPTLNQKAIQKNIADGLTTAFPGAQVEEVGLVFGTTF